MLNEKQMSEIREHLEKAQRPVFFYDNDVDGFCSCVMFMRYLGRGKAVAVRTNPDVGAGYAKKAQELNADYVFVLDRHSIGKEFVEEIKKLQLPIVWIDHHDVPGEDYDYDNIYSYNPTKNKIKSSEPVTYLAYKIVNRKEDLWIAMMGCIGDHFMPDFSSEFAERFPECWKNKGVKIKDPFEALYTTEIGYYSKALSFGLKDSMTHVIYLQNFLIACKGPGDILLELEGKSSFSRKYADIKKKYDSLLEKAKKSEDGTGVLFFGYGGGLSISAELSNELSFLYPDHFIVAAYNAGAMSNLSIRGKNVKGILEKLLKGFEESSGGGHEGAVGARIKTEDVERFRKEFVEISKGGNG